MGARDWGGDWGPPSKTSCLYGIPDFLGDVGPNRELTSRQVEARKGSPIALSSQQASTHGKKILEAYANVECCVNSILHRIEKADHPAA